MVVSGAASIVGGGVRHKGGAVPGSAVASALWLVSRSLSHPQRP